VPVGDAEKLAAAILRLLNDGALGARLTAAAAARVRADFSVTTMAAKYQTVYTEIYAAGANCLLTSPSVSANHADKI
jgi:glycosyltransferase involved in cell wall biosynthesis